MTTLTTATQATVLAARVPTFSSTAAMTGVIEHCDPQAKTTYATEEDLFTAMDVDNHGGLHPDVDMRFYADAVEIEAIFDIRDYCTVLGWTEVLVD